MEENKEREKQLVMEDTRVLEEPSIIKMKNLEVKVMTTEASKKETMTSAMTTMTTTTTMEKQKKRKKNKKKMTPKELAPR